MTPRSQPGEWIWIAPWVGLALIVLSLLRAQPRLPVPAPSRTVVDGEGTPVQIAVPFRGVALTWGVQLDSYLHDTHAPESLLNAGRDDRAHFGKQVMSWIYPRLLGKDSLWDAKAVSRSRGANAEIETLFAYDPGAFLGIGWGPVPLLRRVGLPALYLSRRAKSADDDFFQSARVETALTGCPGRADALIAEYREAFARLAREVPAGANPLRALLFAGSTRDRQALYVRGSNHPYQIFVTRAGLANASDGYRGERPDPERILAMDPDLVFLLWGQNPREFMRDPRWRGLKAVQDKRVYRMPGSYPAYIGDMQFRPLWSRWMAEVAYPDRMRPQMRTTLRDQFVREFGYRLSDDQIDAQLHLDENQDSAGYQRFRADDRANQRQEPQP